MPPSPALRYSPRREMRAENHKRGFSLEGGLPFNEKDDDLSLFNEMQTKEREDFLLQSSDDFEDTFSTKLRRFSDLRLGISIPVRGESSEMLHEDGEKNDYDWLLTPPDTPLFPSLDDEPQQVNIVRRGRPRSQPISISRSSTMEKSHRSSRGSASPNRSSPSPRSGNSTFQSRGRPSSAPHSSPTPGIRSTTPMRRPSPSPSKPSTPAPRSSTPTPRRVSTGSSSSGVRGSSPIRTSRGSSSSPKIRAWQSNIPGFSSDAPPNLRTSLADRPASYVRGSSPASRNGQDSTSKFSRQSMSPTASRSVSSSHSHDRDLFSSHSKGSVASSGDDDIDSIQSVALGGSIHVVSKRLGASPNNKALAFSKKSTRILSPSSAPKRTFDSALRQMDYRKTPQNMFRPLLSSVPSSTFYSGKSSSAHRSLISRNSSVTTSSNASSDQGTSAAPDTEGSDHHQDDTVSDCGKVPCPDVEEVFVFDKLDILNQNIEHERHDSSHNIQLGDFDKELSVEFYPGDSEQFSHLRIDFVNTSTSDTLCVMGELTEFGDLEDLKICTRCCCRYRVTEPVETDPNLCVDCYKENHLVAVTIPETTVAYEDLAVLSVKSSEVSKQFDKLKPLMVLSEPLSHFSDMVEFKLRISEHEKNAKHDQFASDQVRDLFTTAAYSLPDRDMLCDQLQQPDENSKQNAEASEVTGISILLKRSSSTKGPVIQGRTCIATTIPYEDLSYTRNSANSLRSSIGHGSASASSSVDFSSSRLTDTHVQRQFSGRKSELENYRYDINTRTQSVGTSSSGFSNHTNQTSSLATSTNENWEVSVGDIECQVGETGVASQAKVRASENKAGSIDTSLDDAAALEKDFFELDHSSRTMDASTSELSCHTVSIQAEENSVISFPNYEDYSSFEEYDTTLSTSPDGLDVAEVHVQSSLATISEIEIENCCQNSPDSLIDDLSPKSKSNMNESIESSVRAHSDSVASVQESNNSDVANAILEDSSVMVECRAGNKGRSLTLEEATDTILFCSSIVHNLAYQAATIAIEKEKDSVTPLECPRHTVTLLGKSNSDRKEPRGRIVGKHNSKSHKARQRRVETDTMTPSSKTENDENDDEHLMSNVGLPSKADSMKPPKLESKCNCTIM
ncbi:hypothetical protein CFOL_v3_28893, partial [Cephalotus follicularis]